jgi:acyl carrier protein
MPLDDKTVRSAVMSGIEAVTGKPEASLSADARLIGDLKMESIDIIDLLFEIEKRLGISINLADVFQQSRGDSLARDQFDLRVSEIIAYVIKVAAE